MMPLDYTFEIILAICAIYVAFLVYIRYFRVNKNTDGDKLLALYLDVEKAKKK
jgi:hypothetical protein